MGLMSRLASARGGNAITAFAVSIPVLLALAGAALDYANGLRMRSSLQSAADGAALIGAKELRLAGAKPAAVAATAEAYARAALPDVSDLAVAGKVGTTGNSFAIRLSTTVPSVLPRALSPLSTTVAANAEARVFGSVPTCLLGLDGSDNDTVAVVKAKISGPNCAVYANSTDPAALAVSNNGAIKASLVCSAGGVRNQGSITPTAKTDCPPTSDPLSGRVAPPVGACNHQDMVAHGVVLLAPGVYCGGLRLANGTVATLLPGVFVIKDGPFEVDNGAVLTGAGAGFYLTGAGAVFDIAPKTTVNLVAPISGPLAGMLFFEDRANPRSTHRINSRNAPVLLGTFYLPNSDLEVGAPGGAGLLTDVVGALSAWTIVVARRISIADGLDLTLNTDYSGSSVPVPDGVGGGSVSLVQ